MSAILLTEAELATLTLVESTPQAERRWTAMFDPIVTPDRAGLLDEQIREELGRTDGTPEWRAWVLRTAKHLHLS